MLLLRDNCSLCGRVFSHYALKRCRRCGRRYCKDCVTFDEEGEVLCLNCARSIVLPRRFGTKYSPLSRYLLRRAKYATQVTLGFAEIEGIIGDNLPFGALRNRAWWSNTLHTSQGEAWLSVGWKVQNVDLTKRTVTLTRVTGKREEKSRKRRKTKHANLFELPPKPKRRLVPSKTKIARAQARLKNIERRRSSLKRYKGKFKPQPALEKRLFKPEAKPTIRDG
jgi:hypothetical protein